MASNPVYIALAAAYFAGLMVAGVRSARHKGDSNQYLNATSSLPAWVCAASSIAANCGSLDLFAMMALGAQYGLLACHFYWIGSIPALLVAAFVLLPAYRRGRNPTVLDYIGRHYGDATRSLVALCMAAAMLLIAGVSLCAAAQTAAALLGWTYLEGLLAAAAIVLLYTWCGGFRATVYVEIFHFAFVLVAVVPLLFLVAGELGGFGAMLARIPASRAHAWRGLAFFAPHAVMDGFGLVFGLGLVLGCGYWSTDFVQLQRAFAVRREEDAPLIPLSIGFAKLVFALLIALTGVAAPLVLSHTQRSRNWNATLPDLMRHYDSPVWLAIGLMGLAASLISTFSNNVAGFTSAWVQGIYQRRIRPEASDAHYKLVSRLTNAGVVLLAVGTASFALGFQSLMEYIQLILSTFNAPLFALVALAALAPRRAAASGRAGFLLGLACSILHQVLALTHVLRYGSQMAANFYGAVIGFCVALVSTLALGGLRTSAAAEPDLPWKTRLRAASFRWPVVAAGMSLAVLFLLFNAIFW